MNNRSGLFDRTYTDVLKALELSAAELSRPEGFLGRKDIKRQGKI